MRNPIHAGLGVAVLLMLTAAQAGAAPCAGERSRAEIKTLVDRCLQVSPATHPPCNGQNDCPMIEDEISRGCSMLGEAERPGFCSDYLDN